MSSEEFTLRPAIKVPCILCWSLRTPRLHVLASFLLLFRDAVFSTSSVCLLKFGG